MPFPICSLHQLGWRTRYAHDLTLDDFEAGYPARVVAVDHDRFSVLSSRGPDMVTWPLRRVGAEAGVVIGDWLLVGRRSGHVSRLLRRRSLLAAAAVDGDRRRPPIAANLDTLFIVTACDTDFHVARLRRYLALAFAARVTPVVVVTKPDLCVDAPAWLATAQRLLPEARVLLVNANEPASVAQLEPWLASGNTVALVGSAGAGKTALVRHWLDDALDGFHGHVAGEWPAGPSPSMRLIRSGAWIIETPGLHALGEVTATTSWRCASGHATSWLAGRP